MWDYEDLLIKPENEKPLEKFLQGAIFLQTKIYTIAKKPQAS